MSKCNNENCSNFDKGFINRSFPNKCPYCLEDIKSQSSFKEEAKDILRRATSFEVPDTISPFGTTYKIIHPNDKILEPYLLEFEALHKKYKGE